MAGFVRRRKNGRNAFQTGAKIHFSEKKSGGLGALKYEICVRLINSNQDDAGLIQTVQPRFCNA